VWTVFDADGGMLGKMVLPNDLTRSVLSFGDSTVLIRRNDEMGAVHMTVYRLAGIKNTQQ
jgi:hypothetical protein